MRSNYNTNVQRPAQQLTLLRACSLSAFLLAPAALAGYRVSTITGNPCAIGTLDGQGAAALLDAPAGLAWDDAAQVGYVVDVTAQVVRRFTVDGELTTIAGVPGSPGLRDGPGGTALFNFPTDVALDSAGNLFVADSQNHAIRKIDSADFVSTVTGSLTAPTALIVAPSGDIFVVDNNRQIKVVSQSGAVRSLAGDQSAPAIIQDGWEEQARFRSVQSIALAPNGLIFVTDTCTVRTITADG
jgi:sugar lactone lactonase YvrE